VDNLTKKMEDRFKSQRKPRGGFINGLRKL
jgi:hypothetical protein